MQLPKIMTFQRPVTPAKAGVQNLLNNWIPAYAGMTVQGHLESDKTFGNFYKLRDLKYRGDI